jgi:hypothetical protein
VLAQQKARAEQSNSNATDLTKYFTVALPNGVSSGEKCIRILPPKEGQMLFTEVWFHSIKVGGTNRKLYDPGKNEKKPSPLTDVYNVLKNSNDPADKALARNYYPRLFYVIKGIERGKEHEGVKFWRFPHSNRGDGHFDSITPLFKRYGDISDPETGRDMVLTLKKVKNSYGSGEYTTIQSILADDPSPLSTDSALKEQWLADPMTWEDVYKKYEADYLLIVAQGDVPTWSESDNKWIAKPSGENDESSGTQDTVGDSLPPKTDNSAPAATNSTKVDINPDDLPF